MKALETMQQVLMWLCIYPVEKNERKKFACIGLSAIVLAILATQVIGSMFFVSRFLSIDLERSLYALYQITGWAPIFHMFVVAIISRHKITALFGELSKIYETINKLNADEKSFSFLTEANKKSDWIWKMYLKYAMTYNVFGAALTGSICTTILCFIENGHFIRDNLYIQFQLILPWNQQTPIGYIAETCLSMMICEAYLFVNGSIFQLFIAFCLHHRAFYQIFQYNLFKLERIQDDGKVKEQLCKLIRFHIEIKGWFFKTAKVVSQFVMILMISTMLSLACVVFQMDLKMQHPDIGLGFLMIAAIVNTSGIFVYCYFGRIASDSYMEMSNCLYDSNWQKLSISSQKYILLMIQNTQLPLYYHGFNVFILSLETFAKLLKTVGTYYMMLKTIVN